MGCFIFTGMLQAGFLVFIICILTRLDTTSVKRDAQIDASMTQQRVLIDNQMDMKDSLRKLQWSIDKSKFEMGERK